MIAMVHMFVFFWLNSVLDFTRTTGLTAFTLSYLFYLLPSLFPIVVFTAFLG